MLNDEKDGVEAVLERNEMDTTHLEGIEVASTQSSPWANLRHFVQEDSYYGHECEPVLTPRIALKSPP